MFKPWKQPIQLPSHNGKYTYRATANQLKQPLYGIKSTAKWPAKGMPAIVYDGITFWVRPLGKIIEHTCWGKPKREGMNNRLMCACPECHRTISYGRLHQHLKVHACPTCGDIFPPDFGALSRKDNKTMLCSKCGTKEAFS